MKSYLITQACLLVVLVASLLAVNCTPKEDIEEFNITPYEIENGVVVIQRAATGQTSFKLTINQGAEFFQSSSKNSIAIQKSGEGMTFSKETELFWVEVERINNRGTRLQLPVLITNRPEEFKEAIFRLTNYQNHKEELVLFLRHVDAYEGSDQVDSGIEGWWRSCDPLEARQVSEAGKIKAKQIGDALKRLKIPTEKGLSSEFCRAVQTLEFMELGLEIQKFNILNHSNYNQVENIFPPVLDLVSEYITPNELLLVSGHSNLLMGNPDFSRIITFDMSDGFILRKNTQGTMEFVGTMPMMLWEAFIYSDFLP